MDVILNHYLKISQNLKFLGDTLPRRDVEKWVIEKSFIMPDSMAVFRLFANKTW